MARHSLAKLFTKLLGADLVSTGNWKRGPRAQFVGRLVKTVKNQMPISSPAFSAVRSKPSLPNNSDPKYGEISLVAVAGQNGG